MTITQNDVRLYASERMSDFADGGGRMSSTVILDGLDNNVFPDITDIERLTGRTSLRKIFGAVVSNNTDTYLSSHALLDDDPDDAGTGAVLFSFGNLTTERAEAIAAFQATVSAALSPGVEYTASGGTATAGSAVVTSCVFTNTALFDAGLGKHFLVRYDAGGAYGYSLRRVVSRSGNDLTLDATLPFTAANVSVITITAFSNNTVCYGVTNSPGAIGSGATSVTVASLMAKVAPFADGAAAPSSGTAVLGIDASKFTDSAGYVPILRAGDLILLHSTLAVGPTARANGDTVNVARTTLSRLRVIGNNGVEHARFTRGAPAPVGVGCTADLDAGTVTFTDVSGMSQPLTIEHRIEEMSVANTLTGVTIGLNRATSRAYPAGTRVSSLLMLGDLQGRATAGFAQSAWTGAWSDTRIGGEPIADFDDIVSPIVTTNKGAVPQRWTVQFTNSTAFRVFGEFLGEVGTGSTAGDFAPVNPATGAAYFTIPAAGWGASWSAGNCYRFNTAGAQAPLWVLRSIAPSVPGGNDSATVEFRGYVNT